MLKKHFGIEVVFFVVIVLLVRICVYLLLLAVSFVPAEICSEKNAQVFKNHFLTILYPVDRFSELGPCSRTYFSDTGFTCLQILEFIYVFYQVSIIA